MDKQWRERRRRVVVVMQTHRASRATGITGLLSLFLFLLLPSLRSFSLFRGRFARLVTTMARVKNSITLPPFTFFPSIPSPPSSLVSLSIVIAFRKNFKTDIDLFENFKNLSILDVKIPSFNRVSYLSRDDKRSNFEITAIKLLI